MQSRQGKAKATLIGVGLMGVFGILTTGCTGNSSEKASLPARPPAVVNEQAASNATAEKPAEVAAENVAIDAAKEPAISGKPEIQTPVPLDAAAETSGAQRLAGAVSSTRRSQMSFRVGGFVETIVAKPGTVVKKGETLATLDDRDFVTKFELAKARRELAQVGMENARKEFQREQQLKKENASTAASFDKLLTTFEQAKLSLRVAELDQSAAERDLENTKLKAPYDCVVATQSKYEGENVQMGNVVFEVYDVGIPEVTVSAPERLLGQLSVGGTLEVNVPSANFKGKGEIVRLVPVISDRTRTFQIILKLQDAEAKVAPGSYAEAVLN